MFNRTNVMLDIIKTQAIVIAQITDENKILRKMYNEKAIQYKELE